MKKHGNSYNDLSDSSGADYERVRELLRYNILDTPDEKEFDDITKVAAYLCDANCSQINFLDHDRQWSKSCYGWDLRLIPRNESICNYTIQQEKYLIINDLSKDPRFKDFSYVKEKKVQFYAGVVLKSSHGYNLGTLCVFDNEPGELSKEQLESLKILGRDVETKLELRIKREQLTEEHKKLLKTAAFLHNSADLMVILNKETLKIEEVNREVVELLGYSEHEVVDTKLTEYISKEDFAEKLVEWSANQPTERFTFGTTFKTKTKGDIWLQITITEERDKYFVTGRDISIRKKIEQNLRKQKQFTEDIIRHLPGIFFLINEEGRVVKWNNNLEEIEQRVEEEVLQQSFKEFIAEKDHRSAEQALQKAFKEGFSRTEINFVGKNGQFIPLLLNGFRYVVDNNNYVIGIGINISEEKEALRELEQKEKKLKEAQRIGRMGSWTWKIPEDELIWSDEYYEILGLDKENTEPTVEFYFSLLPESEVKSVEELVDGIMEGRGMEDIEHQMLKSDGSVIYVHQRGETQYDDKGNAIRVDGIIQDVTARRKAEEKVKAALKEKEVLLAEVHHRVKNNLAIVHGLLQLEHDNRADEELKMILAGSQMRIKTMALIHETLYSSGDFVRIPYKGYLEELTQSILDSFLKDPERIQIDLDSEDVSLNINQAIPCGLIVNELVTNAIQHAFPGDQSGTVRITLRETEDDRVLIVISDNGVGLDTEIDPENPSTLGLTLINSLVKQIDGELEFERDKGTVFKITFRKDRIRGSSASIYPSGE
jgi:PAS domain S-box-containing protein